MGKGPGEEALEFGEETVTRLERLGADTQELRKILAQLEQDLVKHHQERAEMDAELDELGKIINADLSSLKGDSNGE